MNQPNRNSTSIIEIFSSIQGEGPYVGYKQLFMRFPCCNLNCNYCDTSFNPPHTCKIDYTDKISFELNNPVNINETVEVVKTFAKRHFHSISFTGGEPLLHAEFINSLIDELKALLKVKFYLETNGTLPENLKKVVHNIDVICMDIKIESSTGQKMPYKEHNEFMKIAAKYKKEVFAKAVITNNLTKNELEMVCKLCKENKVHLILQPVTTDNANLKLSEEKIAEIFDAALAIYTDIRLIPQVHRFINIR